MAVTGDYSQNSAPVQRGPPSGVNLIGTKKHILNPQTGHSVEHTVIDYGHTVLGGYFYILEYQTPAGSRTRNLTQDEYEEMTPYHKRA
ncbi:hypothetical protein BT96DRAFT_919543 [Gymnopus androsaceus JB14]|uniref:Uncharacterized protein n=1 Tax=Gymnopus androsaceus JB14 TaxID=1447944 RepID=A0A6A4HQN0_9AGAR|nr:hypothetical protein BT96DRAFT_919543 [Gymnopus androsaceus JB14]